MTTKNDSKHNTSNLFNVVIKLATQLSRKKFFKLIMLLTDMYSHYYLKPTKLLIILQAIGGKYEQSSFNG